jgi:RNA polymerase sigma factor (sigma-70 family)
MTEINKQQTDEALIARAQKGETQATEELILRYGGLVRKLSRRYFLVGGETEDLIQEGMIGLFKAIRDFDPEKGVPFAGFAKLCVERQIYTAIESAGRLKNSPLNAYIDKVQFYSKALSQANIIKSMSSPLVRDSSLLGYWNFEDGCTTDAEGFMQADKGSVKAAMYKILTNGIMSIGTEVKPFSFGEGVDSESVIQGVEESITEVSKTKAFVSNEMLNIENAEGINSVVVYDAMGKGITSVNANGATSTQIALSLTIKGVIMVKVNNEVIKVVCD